jgi:aconitate hydratase
VRCIVHKRGGIDIEFQALHTFSPEQVEWFKAGSALNVVREKVKKSKK